MADLESGKTVQGQQDNPSSAVVQGQEGASTSNDGLEALIEKLLNHPKLKEELQKGFQSTKDKRIGKLEGEITKIQETLAGVDRYEAYRQKGLSPEDAKRQMQIDDLLANKPAPEPERPGNAMDWATIRNQLRESGLPDELLGENPQEFAQKLNNKLKPASPAAIVQPAGGSPGEPDLRKAYESELAKIPRGNVQKIVELKEAYRKKGLSVY